MLTTRTPEAHAAALARFKSHPQPAASSCPGAAQGTLIFPGYDGGAEWGGAAFDPETVAPLRQLERDGLDPHAW